MLTSSGYSMGSRQDEDRIGTGRDPLADERPPAADGCRLIHISSPKGSGP